MNAYDEIYLDDAMKNLGEAFDYAGNVCKIDMDRFAHYFISSGVATAMEREIQGMFPASPEQSWYWMCWHHLAKMLPALKARRNMIIP